MNTKPAIVWTACVLAVFMLGMFSVIAIFPAQDFGSASRTILGADAATKLYPVFVVTALVSMILTLPVVISVTLFGNIIYFPRGASLNELLLFLALIAIVPSFIQAFVMNFIFERRKIIYNKAVDSILLLRSFLSHG